MNSSFDNDLLSNPNPLVVGVTGRRYIVPAALERVEASARTFLRRIVEDWRGKGPIYALTGLAIGADQLAARLVLEEKERDSASPLRLVAVLPMKAAEYANDFSRDVLKTTGKERSELDEFQRLLNAADYVVETPATPENVERTRRGEKIDRSAQYSALGETLVERSRILLAFWNGNASEIKRGGTADVVLSKARRNASFGGEIVYCVSTPEVLRRKNPDGTKTNVPEPAENAGNVAVLTPPTSNAPVFVASEIGAQRLGRFLRSLGEKTNG